MMPYIRATQKTLGQEPNLSTMTSGFGIGTAAESIGNDALMGASAIAVGIGLLLLLLGGSGH